MLTCDGQSRPSSAQRFGTWLVTILFCGSRPGAIAALLLNVGDWHGDAPALAGAGENPKCYKKKKKKASTRFPLS